MRATSSTNAAVTVAAMACALGGAVGSCQSRGTTREIASGALLTPLVAPRGGENDAIASLVDGRIEPMGWYCAHRQPPQRYEVMLAESEPRMIRAVGLVAGNLGPDGLGPVHVRVQTGHGPASRGEDFEARLAGRNDQPLVVELPSPVRGDHVVISLLRRSPYVTANCLGEIMVYPVDGATREPADALVVRASPAAPEPPDATRRAGRADGASARGAERGDAGAGLTDAAAASPTVDAATTLDGAPEAGPAPVPLAVTDAAPQN